MKNKNEVESSIKREDQRTRMDTCGCPKWCGTGSADGLGRSRGSNEAACRSQGPTRGAIFQKDSSVPVLLKGGKAEGWERRVRWGSDSWGPDWEEPSGHKGPAPGMEVRREN